MHLSEIYGYIRLSVVCSPFFIKQISTPDVIYRCIVWHNPPPGGPDSSIIQKIHILHEVFGIEVPFKTTTVIDSNFHLRAISRIQFRANGGVEYILIGAHLTGYTKRRGKDNSHRIVAS